MKLEFKTIREFKGMCVGLDPKLTDILVYIASKWPVMPVVTSTHRPGDGGVHGTIPLRGIDLRRSPIDPIDLCKQINANWQYDPTRPNMQCAIYHNTGSGPHIHLQVHPLTKETI